MNRSWKQWMLGVAVLAGIGLTIPTLAQEHQAPGGGSEIVNPDSKVAPTPKAAPIEQTGRAPAMSVEEMKAAAFNYLKHGKFDGVSQLLTQAASISSNDATLKQMAVWASQFQSQREGFIAERRKAYDKAVADVELLLKNHKESYAIDLAARAYLLADDKKAFRKEAWVDSLVATNVKLAEQAEAGERWLQAMSIYSDLGQIEPAVPLWKDKLKTVTRRVRLLAIFTPDQLKILREKEFKERMEVDALLRPTTQPATKPSEWGNNEAFKIDWKETLKDIRMSMLRDALEHAAKDYYRDITYRQMTEGGLNAMRVVATTAGLETVFPQLADAGKKEAFIKTIDELTDRIRQATPENEQIIANQVLNRLAVTNSQTVQLPDEVLVSEYADGAFAELDPFTSMIWPSEVAEFNKTTQGEFSGVGIQIQSDDDGSLKVVSPIEDSPAYKSGIKAGDIITHINGKNAKGITTTQAVKSITGPPGTSVVLTVRASDLTTKDYTLRRETIKVASIKGYLHLPGGGWDYFVDKDQKIAYMRLTNFTRTTGDELDKAVDELKTKGCRAIILDLRYNPGGLLTAATDVSDKFLHDGVIVSTRADRDTPNSPTVATAHADGGETDMPLVVLVNQYSASASEIVSGALKDQHRAIIVGERTFGKGSVQMLFQLNTKAAYLKLTTSHYYLPSGKCIHREENSQEWGVDPDVTVEMTPEQMRAAIDARQDLDILRDNNDTPAPVKEPSTTQPAKKDLLASDPQLSAGLLLLRLKLSGASL